MEEDFVVFEDSCLDGQENGLSVGWLLKDGVECKVEWVEEVFNCVMKLIMGFLGMMFSDCGNVVKIVEFENML